MSTVEQAGASKHQKSHKTASNPHGLPFAITPRCILADPELSDRAKVVWAALDTWSRCETIRPSTAAIAERAGMSRAGVHRAVSELRSAGLVDVFGNETGGRSITRRYVLADETKLRDRYQDKLPNSCAVYPPETARQVDSLNTETAQNRALNCPPAGHEVEKEAEKKKRTDRFFAFSPAQIDVVQLWTRLMEYIPAGGKLDGIPPGAKLLHATLIGGFGGFDRLATQVKDGSTAKDLGFLYRQFETFYSRLGADGLKNDWEPPAPGQSVPSQNSA